MTLDHAGGFALSGRKKNVPSPGISVYGINILIAMTKRDIVTRISQDSGYVQDQVFDIVQRTLDVIAESLRNGETIELRNFGVFEVKVRKARVGRNPNQPEKDVPIPARAVVKFKPGKEMRAAVLKLTAKFKK